MKLVFEKSKPGHRSYSLPKLDVTPQPNLLPQSLLRKAELKLPELAPIEVARHYNELASRNLHIDRNFYPLGSCTMKYNPPISERLVSHPSWLSLHPLAPASAVQGALRVMYELEHLLAEISGMDAVTLHPAAGAHGELVGLLLARAYFKHKHEDRSIVLIPDSAHGTNPASARMAGFTPVEIKSTPSGMVDINELKRHATDKLAVIMLTVPNTLGIFEKDILKIAQIVHEAGGIMYLDGANLNSYVGWVKPGEMGFDIVHFNLHKTFGAPHGSGGPGGGALGVKKFLEPFLPVPRVKKRDNKYYWDSEHPHSIGKIHTFYGNFLVNLKGFIYIRMMGSPGLKKVAEHAVLNANYLATLIREILPIPYPGPYMHEFVASGKPLLQYDVRTIDLAKRLLDKGFHPPTIYFPLIVKEALMIEPTETESKATLDAFATAIGEIVNEAQTHPDIVKNAPHSMPVKRVNEGKASRDLNVNYYG